MNLNLKQVFGVEVENVQMSDYPDFCDAYISKAYYQNSRGSRELTEEELDKLNENGEYVYQQVMDFLY